MKWMHHGQVMGIIARMTFLEQVSNRLPWAVVLVWGIGTGLAILATTGAEMTQGAMMGALFRIGAVFSLTAAVITSMAREFNDRRVEATLALAIPRAVYLGGKLTGFILTALPMALLFGLGLLPFAPWEQTLLWGISLGYELILMAAFSLLLVLTLTHVTRALLIAMALWMLARSIHAMILMASTPLAELNPLSGTWVTPILKFISWLLPDLGRFTSGEWLLHHTGRWQDLGTLTLETLFTLFLLCGAGLYDFYKKDL
ncbi:MAG: ABC transporter permease [Magnetococcales bacterium]|nr:ABC transporter permease [Magnetococcales bacterium]